MHFSFIEILVGQPKFGQMWAGSLILTNSEGGGGCPYLVKRNLKSSIPSICEYFWMVSYALVWNKNSSKLWIMI